MKFIFISFAGVLLLGLLVLKLKTTSFGNLEWIALAIFFLLYFMALLVAALVDKSDKDSDNIAALLANSNKDK